MDASQITKLLQKQHNRHIQRPQTVDASTLTWKKQLLSSTQVRSVHETNATLVPCCPDPSPEDLATFLPVSTPPPQAYGGQGKQTTLTTGSTMQFPNVFSSATGSASHVYSADRLLLQRAGKHACAIESSLPCSTPIDLPACFCRTTNVPTEEQVAAGTPNPQTNPYLPPFDTYYRFKHSCDPIQDKNQKHHVPTCHTRFLRNDAPYGCTPSSSSPSTCDGCVREQ
jgi:hypothetical protein